MNSDEVLRIVLREMCEYGSGWRLDWSSFDGRYLRDQLDELALWAERALKSDEILNYDAGTKFHQEQSA